MTNAASASRRRNPRFELRVEAKPQTVVVTLVSVRPVRGNAWQGRDVMRAECPYEAAEEWMRRLSQLALAMSADGARINRT